MKKEESAVRFPKKIIDEAAKNRFVLSLPHTGRLFEIYFVRLIGTPNQNSKNGVLTSVRHLALT
jgi:hypothetical protein